MSLTYQLLLLNWSNFHDTIGGVGQCYVTLNVNIQMIQASLDYTVTESRRVNIALGKDCNGILLSVLRGCDCFLSSLRRMEKKAFARLIVTYHISGIMLIFSKKYFISGAISTFGATTGLNLNISTVILQDPSYYRGHTSELNENGLYTATPTTFRFLRML